MHPCPSWNFPSVCSWGSVIFFPLLILLRLLLSLRLELPDLSFSYRHGCLKSSLYPSFVLVFWQYLLCHTHSFISEMYRETSNTSVSLWSISWEIVAMAIDTWILQKTVEFCQENALVIANTLFQHHKRRLYHGHYQMVNTKLRLIIFFAAKDGETLYSQQKQDLGLTVAKIMSSLLQNSDLSWRK